MSESETHVQSRLVAGRYRLMRELGRGGMGVVWLAEDQLVGRQVAVKELRPPPGAGAAERETFGLRALAEARSAARIHHPGAVMLFDVVPADAGDDDDAVYLIMELVDGPTLEQLVEAGPLPAAQVAAFGLQLLDVLETAHALGVVHRDVKPANIIITADGQVKLTDFGIAHAQGDARLTRSGIMGTQAYMAPELFNAAPISPAVDVWSLGATLYAAVAGRGPFDRDTTGATLRAILVDQLPSPGCPEPLAAAISGMLQRDPARRASIGQARGQLTVAAQLPGAAQSGGDQATARLARQGSGLTARAMAEAVTTSSPSPPVQAPQLPFRPPVSPPGDPGRNRKVIWGAAALLIVAAVAVAVPVLLSRSHSHNQSSAVGPSSPSAAPGPPASTQPAVAPAPAASTRPAATLTEPGSAVGVNSVAFSPNGQTVATGDSDGDVYLWDTATGQISGTLTMPPVQGTYFTNVFSVAFSPDGTMLAVGDDDDSSYVWDVSTGKLLATLTDPDSSNTSAGQETVNSVAFSPDGRTLAAGDSDGSAYLWDLATSQITATLTPPGASSDAADVSSVVFSPDGQTLAVVGGAKTYLWNVATGQMIAALDDGNNHAGAQAAAFSPDGKTLAVADGDGTIFLWNVATHRIAVTLPGPGGISPSGQSVAFSPDGQMLASSDGTPSIYVWDVATHRITANLTGPGSNQGTNSGFNGDRAVFSPDGKTLATTNGGLSTYIWDIG